MRDYLSALLVTGEGVRAVTLDDLEDLIGGALWFARCGQFPGEPGAVPLAAVASADTWAWLPTSADLPDPVHGGALVAEAEAAGLGQARRDAELAVARRVLAGLREIPGRVPAPRIHSTTRCPPSAISPHGQYPGGGNSSRDQGEAEESVLLESPFA
jgi:hypothetical protein